jgi:hypothetical protein
LRFDEIPAKSKIVITVTNGSDLQARFLTKVMRNCQEYLMVIPFRHKGLRINFSGKNVKIHMEYRDNEGRLWTYRNCKIQLMKKDGLIFHKLLSPMTEGIENRRGGRRFFLWDNCTVEIDGMEAPIYTKIRDIGPEGISFVIDAKKPLPLKEGTNLKCIFKTNQGDVVTAEAMIVRKEALEKYTVYGCKVANPSAVFTSYVAYQERKNIVIDADI